MTTIPWILSEGKKLSIGNKTKSESLTENLIRNRCGPRVLVHEYVIRMEEPHCNMRDSFVINSSALSLHFERFLSESFQFIANSVVFCRSGSTSSSANRCLDSTHSRYHTLKLLHIFTQDYRSLKGVLVPMPVKLRSRYYRGFA